MVIFHSYVNVYQVGLLGYIGIIFPVAKPPSSPPKGVQAIWRKTKSMLMGKSSKNEFATLKLGWYYNRIKPVVGFKWGIPSSGSCAVSKGLTGPWPLKASLFTHTDGSHLWSIWNLEHLQSPVKKNSKAHLFPQTLTQKIPIQPAPPLSSEYFSEYFWWSLLSCTWPDALLVCFTVS